MTAGGTPDLEALTALLASARADVSGAFSVPPFCHDDMTLQWHPLLLAEAARTALCHRLSDAVYRDRPALFSRRHVTVACPALADGQGDLALARRVARAVAMHAPDALITLVVPDDRKEAMQSAADAPGAVVAASVAQETLLLCDLLIVAPDPSAARHSSSAMRAFIDEAARRYPSLAVTEYGSAAPASPGRYTFATGLGPLSEGIFIDAALARQSQRVRSASPQIRRQARDAYIATLPQTGPPAPPHAHGCLHLVYVREPEAVAAALAHALHHHRLRQGAPQDLLVVIPRPGGTASVGREVMRAWQHVAGDAQVRVLPPLPPALFREGLLHADFAAVTGDQSFGEAVSAQVRFVYEVRPHKQAFVHRLQEVAGRFGPAMHDAMRTVDQPPTDAQAPDAAWQAMCDHIREKCDATQGLVGRAARAMLSHPASRRIEEDIAKICNVQPGPADAALLQHLQGLRACTFRDV